MMKLPNNISSSQILLLGKVGSQAYGLATGESDTDYLGVFAWPTEKILGLGKPHDSIVTHEPDTTLHEIRKWCGLAIGCNPTVMELVWLPDEMYERTTPLGQELRTIRKSFLSAQRVKDAYLGYATQQFVRLVTRADGSFSSDTRKRTSKHARHLARLCWQGLTLHRTGELQVKLDDPEFFRDFGEQVADGNLDVAKKYLSETSKEFYENSSPLPDQPNTEEIEDLLIRIRRFYF